MSQAEYPHSFPCFLYCGYSDQLPHGPTIMLSQHDGLPSNTELKYAPLSCFIKYLIRAMRKIVSTENNNALAEFLWDILVLHQSICVALKQEIWLPGPGNSTICAVWEFTTELHHSSITSFFTAFLHWKRCESTLCGISYKDINSFYGRNFLMTSIPLKDPISLYCQLEWVGMVSA